MPRFEIPSLSVTPRGSVASGGDGRSTIVRLQGEHDASTKALLLAAFRRAVVLDDANVVADLAAVTFMDASTVGVLVNAQNRLRAQARSLAVRAPSRAAQRILELCGLAELYGPEASNHPTGNAAALGTWVDVPRQLSTLGVRVSADESAALSELNNSVR